MTVWIYISVVCAAERVQVATAAFVVCLFNSLKMPY